MRVVVTRPQREAQAWVRSFQQAGHEAWALPLIGIGPAPDLALVQQAWHHAARYQAVMFVSANAVGSFFSQRPADSPPIAQAWATGPGTVRALRQAGVPEQDIVAPSPDAAQFDSEALWQQVRERVSGRTEVLIVRGADAQGLSSEGAGRDWFAQQLRQAGAGVEFLASYQRQRPEPTAAALQRARAAASDGSVWVFSSSEAVHNLQFVLPAQDWAAAVAVATHARIAAAVRAAGFGQVRESRPSLPNVLASIESVA
ncbi:MAG: uroporphyrinogen-III synthase [Curvibacter sp.]|jgi:uroporphyrinogen-III synthase|nr:uroporphyrinogen-III synthase [Curvibacter sp.]